MPRTETLAEDQISKEALHENTPASNDHWMRRVSIMTLLSGVGVTVGGFNIAELDETLGHQISLVGVVIAAIGLASWLVTHLILKGSRNV